MCVYVDCCFLYEMCIARFGFLSKILIMSITENTVTEICEVQLGKYMQSDPDGGALWSEIITVQ